MNTEYINKILEIGKRGICTDQELSYFLPNLPDVANKDLLHVLRSEYGISTRHWTRRDILAIDAEGNAQSLRNEDERLASFIVDLVKGIHIIEFKSGYGGSSTTTICNLFGTLIEKDVKSFIDLYNWIASNGGNYYIESGVIFEESKKREQNAEKNRIEMLANDQKIHSDAVARKQANRDLHTKASDETQRLYKECKEKLQKMSDEQLIDSFNKDVGNLGWVGARARFHSALHEEFESRGFDFSVIGNKNSFSFANKISLIGKKIEKNTLRTSGNGVSKRAETVSGTVSTDTPS